MPLPIAGLAQDTVTVADTPVQITSLSRANALALNGFKGHEEDAEVFILVHGTGCTEAEAQAFREQNSVNDAGTLIDAILILSGLANDNPKT